MPIFEYTCKECQNLFEVLILSKDAKEDISCTKCKSINIQKTISAGSYRSTTGSSQPTSRSGCTAPSGFT